MKTVALPTVSVIIPAYNSASYIAETIESVQQQTFKDWEMFIVDDASTDLTCEIAKRYSQEDSRIHYISLPTNVGPSLARQKATFLANGRYIAFLDSDDLWLPQKLEVQIDFMRKNNCSISCTAYSQIDETGRSLGKTIIPPTKADYNRVLLDCPVGNSTVIYDTYKLGKCYGPDAKNREDYGMWLKILKKEDYILGLNKVLVLYRIRKGSLSRNKIKLVYYQWILYRDFEHLTILRSLFHIAYWGLIKLLRLK